LQFFGDVAVGYGKIFVGNKLIDLFFVIVLVQDYYRISFVCFGDLGFIFGQFIFHLIYDFFSHFLSACCCK
jgi:uncharacterized membrane protein